MKKAGIIVLNWNGKHFLKDCFASLLRQTYRNYVVVFVDNASTDGSVEFVKKHFARAIGKRLLIVENKENYGFAKGNNIGIDYALDNLGCDVIILLNNDTIVKADWLTHLMAPLKKGASMVSAKTYLKDRKTIDTLGIRKSFFGLAYDIKHTVDLDKLLCPCGVAALYAKEALAAAKQPTGYLDEDFFLYCEDFDLGWRISKKGFGCAFAKNAIVYHVHSGTSGHNSDRTLYHGHRNNVWTTVKNEPLWKLVVFSPLYVAIHVGAIAKYLLKGRTIVLQAKWAALIGLPKQWKKRVR